MILLLSTTTIWMKAQGIEFVHGVSFDALLEKAAKEDKLIFMDCYTNWCGPCKKLAANIFPLPEVGAYFNANFINAKFEMEKDADGPSIAARYGVKAYPTLLWIDGKGNVKHKVVGGLDGPNLIAAGKKAGDPMPGILTGLREQYNKGKRETAFMSDYVSAQVATDELNDKVFEEFLKGLGESDLVNPVYTKTIFNATTHLQSPGLPYLMRNKVYYNLKLGENTFNNKINAIASKAAKDAVTKKDAALYEGALKLVKENKASDVEKQILSMEMDFSSATNDWKAYDKAASAFIKKYGEGKSSVINDVSWLYYLNVDEGALLSKAEKWMYNVINTDNKYTYNITYAYLLFKQNKLKEAEKACDYAILKAKDERVTPTSAEALKGAIQRQLGGMSKQ